MKIKGIAIKSIKEFVMKKYPERFNEWFSGLSSESRDIYKAALSNGWYPIKEAVLEPKERIAKLFFNGDIQKASFESGQYSAEVALKGIYKMYVRFSSPSHVIDRGSRILPAYYDPISIQQLEREKQFVKYEINDCPEISEIVEQSIAGWMHMALEVSGCKTFDVKVVKSMKTDGKTIIDVHWS